RIARDKGLADEDVFASIPHPKISEAAQDDLAKAMSDAVEIVGRIAGPNVRVTFRPVMPLIPGAGIPGLSANTVGGTYVGPTLQAHAVIGIATQDPRYDARTTAGHEAWHHVEDVLATDAEHRLLNNASEMSRMRREYVAPEVRLDPSDPRLDQIPDV